MTSASGISQVWLGAAWIRSLTRPRASHLRRLRRDPLHHPVEARQLRVDDRLAAGDQPARDRPLGIRPAHDVDQPEVAEGLLGVAAVEAEHLGAQHQPVAEAGREAEREVDLQVRLLGQRPLASSPAPSPGRRRARRRGGRSRRSATARSPMVTTLAAGTTAVRKRGSLEASTTLSIGAPERPGDHRRERRQQPRPGDVAEARPRRRPRARRRSCPSGTRAGRGSPRRAPRGCSCRSPAATISPRMNPPETAW